MINIIPAPSTATVISNCSNLLEEATLSSGVIRSNYKPLYSPNTNCHWTITVSSHATLQLVFWKFTTEKSFDTVRVYDGGSTTSPLVGSYSGSSVPAVVNSSTNQLLITFTSDSLFEHSGFVTTYHGTKKCIGFVEVQRLKCIFMYALCVCLFSLSYVIISLCNFLSNN